MLKFIDSLKYPIFRRKLAWSGREKSKKQVIEKMDQPIDFVVTWVDDNDPEWKKERAKYLRETNEKTDSEANIEARTRDWDFFQYWFRAVEKYAPWVRNVYLVTCGQIPKWMNIDSPKLKLVNHTDYIPEQYLPTFNTNPIELNLHRIEGLSEHFVYFNDDVFLNRPVEPEDFFQNGKPNYTAIAYPLKNEKNSAFEHMQFSTLGLINQQFNQQVSRRIQQYPEKWFAEQYGEVGIRANLDAYDKNYIPGMCFPHLGVACRKSTMEKVWEKCFSVMDETSRNRFRTPKDVIHQVFSLWGMMEGEFNPVSLDHHGFACGRLMEKREEIIDAIINKRYRMICINDNERISKRDYLVLKEEFIRAFEQALPDKSSYEK